MRLASAWKWPAIVKPSSVRAATIAGVMTARMTLYSAIVCPSSLRRASSLRTLTWSVRKGAPAIPRTSEKRLDAGRPCRARTRIRPDDVVLRDGLLDQLEAVLFLDD